MREAAGQSIKSALFHTWTRDTRDDSIFGTRGANLKVSQELAGLGGDASFYKTEASGQLARPLFPGLVGLILSYPSNVYSPLCMHVIDGCAVCSIRLDMAHWQAYALL